jgi:Subtilisin inhibitor-like
MAMTPRFRPAQLRSTMVLAGALLSACGVFLAACGSTAAPGSNAAAHSPSSGTHSTAGTTAAAKASLTIVTTAPGNVHRWTLRCDPPGGTKPDAAVACNQLIAHKTILQPSDVKVFCPMIMANAASYVIYGTWFGRTVHETIVDGGCDLSRWSQMHQIFN